MFFRVVWLKETKNKKYNIDILLEWDSESFVRETLQSYNIVVLRVSEHKKSVEEFASIKIVAIHHQQELSIFSYLKDLKNAILIFSMIGFDIKYANFIGEQKIPEMEVKEILNSAQKEAKDIQLSLQIQNETQKKQESKIYKDQTLDKVLKIVDKTFLEIDNLTSKVWETASQSDIRDLSVMKQDLTKLKMWRNDDKMIELLQKIYQTYYKIHDTYMLSLKKEQQYPISWSIVSDVDVLMELEKLNKAKKVKEIGAKRDKDDTFYLSFDKIWLYIRFLVQDITNKAKDLSVFFEKIFCYLEIFAISVLVFSWLIIRSQKITFVIDIYLYQYLFLIKVAIFGLLIFIFKRFKSQQIKKNILILCLIFLSYILLFFMTKFIFIL